MQTSWITADRLFDGTGTASRIKPALQIADDKIQSIDDRPPEGQQCTDLPGCTILPGLIDTHVHLIFSADKTREAIIGQVTSESDDQLLARALTNAKAMLRKGITTVRDCGGKNRLTQRVRDLIQSGESDGADVISCGGPITTTTGHCHWLGLIANSHDEVRRAAEKMIEEDADWLKVMATGGNMTVSSDPMQAQYDDEALSMIADIGRRANKHSAAHVLSRVALPGVVAARYRTIEHCDWRTEEFHYEFDPDLARRMIDQDQYVGLTMSGTTRRAFLPDVAKYPTPALGRLDIRFACERQALDFGIKFNLHTDAGVMNTPFDRFDLGLRAAVIELQLTPSEAIVAATRSAAEAIDLADRGTVVPGKRADLCVVEGDPVQDIACLSNVKAVMKAGRWVEL